MSEKEINSVSFKDKIKSFFTRPVKAGIILLLLFSVIGFVGKKYDSREIQDIKISILNEDDNFFLDDTDLINLMTVDGSDWLIGNRIEDINLKKLENRLNRNPYLKRTEIYTDHSANLNVQAWLKNPIARLIPSQGTHFYLCDDNTFMPLSNRYSSRVMLIRGRGIDYLAHNDSLKTEFGQQFFAFVSEMNKDPFWNAQISEIEILRNREIIIYPQVTKQYIEFGTLDDFQSKIKKLNTFYTEILPFKGWNTYERVCLKYKNQIVCE